MREGSIWLDPTINMSPGSAARAREKFKRLIDESRDRIDILRKRREEFNNNIDYKIEREETYIQEAKLVLRMIEESYGEDYVEEEDDASEILWENQDKEVSDDGNDEHHEIVLYGCPMY